MTAVYCDDAVSGSELSRPGLDSLLTAAESPNIDIVLAWDRNRLARPKDAVDGILLERRLQQSGTRVVYASNGQEMDRSFASGLISYVEHYQNGDYLRKLSRDTMRGLVDRVKRGLWPGGPIPFGYDRLILDGDKPKRIARDTLDGGQVVIDVCTGNVIDQIPKGKTHRKQDHELCTLIPSEPERVTAIQTFFRDYATGKPTRLLRDCLNDAGFRTSRGGRFTVQTILPMLENRAYIGQCVYNRRTHSKWHRFMNGASIERPDEGFERRSEKDWIVCENAWDALVDLETFEAVQVRRKGSKVRGAHVRGNASRSSYLLTGLAYCTVCGGKLTGTTQTSGKGYKTRYYTCSRHSAGYTDECPKRYTVPADLVENHIVLMVESDLMRLRDDDTFHELVLNEFHRLTDSQSDVSQRLESRLKAIDAELAVVREHLLSMDARTARTLGVYEKADALAGERDEVVRNLSEMGNRIPQMVDAKELRKLAEREFEDLESVVQSGTVEEKRALLGQYINRVDAEPERNTVRISLYPPGLSQMVAGVGFEPTTFGL